MKRIRITALIICGCIGIMFTVHFIENPFIVHLLIMMCIWGTAASGWNLIAGYAGQMSLGNAVFYGIGAYTSAILFVKFGVNPWIGLVLAILIAVFISYILGSILFRFSGIYFTIGTLVITEIFLISFTSWTWIGAASGVYLPIIKGGSFQYIQFLSKGSYFCVFFCLLCISVSIVYWIERSKLGLYLKAIRDESIAAASLGINVMHSKIQAYMITAALTAAAGSLYSNYILYVDPMSTLSFDISLFMCLVCIMGGAGFVWGPVLGAIVVIPISELTRSFLGGSGQAIDIMVYGAALVTMAIFQPKGMIGFVGKILKGKIVCKIMSKIGVITDGNISC